MFTFKSIPCGLYECIPYCKGENTAFDVSPSVVSVSVEHQHVTVPQNFEVTGFSVWEHVIDANDSGVEGVKILADGKERSTTDKEGYYKLDQVLVTNDGCQTSVPSFSSRLKLYLEGSVSPPISGVHKDYCR